MALGDTYLASFRQFEPYDSSRFLSTAFGDALAQVPRENAAIAGAFFKAGLDNATSIQNVNATLDYNRERDDKEIEENKKRNRALALAKGFEGFSGGGGGGGIDPSLLAMVTRSNPALDPDSRNQAILQSVINSTSGLANSTSRSSPVTAAILRRRNTPGV